MLVQAPDRFYLPLVYAWYLYYETQTDRHRLLQVPMVYVYIIWSVRPTSETVIYLLQHSRTKMNCNVNELCLFDQSCWVVDGGRRGGAGIGCAAPST